MGSKIVESNINIAKNAISDSWDLGQTFYSLYYIFLIMSGKIKLQKSMIKNRKQDFNEEYLDL